MLMGKLKHELRNYATDEQLEHSPWGIRDGRGRHVRGGGHWTAPERAVPALDVDGADGWLSVRWEAGWAKRSGSSCAGASP